MNLHHSETMSLVLRPEEFTAAIQELLLVMFGVDPDGLNVTSITRDIEGRVYIDLETAKEVDTVDEEEFLREF